ncbi:MAG: archaeosine biosynthesis radical SAM protein RaSEA [Candidatus Hodarchaeota archaeon]
MSRLRTPIFGTSPGDLRRPAATWIEEDLLQTERIKALTIVLRTHGCSWAREHGGCLMCGYSKDSAPIAPQPQFLLDQFYFALEKAKNSSLSVVKIYTSGSFFDEKEIPHKTRIKMLKHLSSLPSLRNVILETRPEYVKAEVIEETKRLLNKKTLEVAMGLETSNDYIREKCIHKGFQYQDYIQAAKKIREHDCSLRVYLLLKPPFLTEQEAIVDTITSALMAVRDGATTVSINPVVVHKGTILEVFWKQKSYRPPWLWSVLETLEQIRVKLPPHCNVISHPVAGGKSRGPHNCGHCDKRVLHTIRTFSLTQDLDKLNDLNCACKPLWKVIKKLEMVNQEPLLEEVIQHS